MALGSRGNSLLITLFVIAVLATVLLTQGWWRGEDNPTPPPTTPDSIALAAPDLTADGPAVAIDAPAPDGADFVSRTDLTGAWTARGKITLGYKEPFPEGRINAQLFEGYETTGAASVEAILTADAAGKFTWSLPNPPQSTVTLRVQGLLENSKRTTDTELVVRGQRAPQDLHIRVYPLDANLTGRIIDQNGEPIPGARARIGTRGKKIDADESGHFQSTVSSARSSITVYASAPGFAVARKSVAAPKPGEVAAVVIQLQRGLTIRGHVVDEIGRGIAGAKVTTFYTSFYRSVESAADGSFVLDDLEAGREQHIVYARKQGLLEGREDVALRSVPEDVKLVLRRGVRIEGTATDPDGNPVAGARHYIGFSSSDNNRIDARSDDDGVFVFPCVKPGEQTLVTEGFDVASDIRALVVPEDITVMRVDLQLDRSHFVAGIAVDRDGTPIPDVGVHARWDKPTDDRYIGTSTQTDADGRFRLDGMPSPTVGLEFYGKSVKRKVATKVAVDTVDHRIELDRPSGIAGQVVDAATGEPIRKFRIRVLDSPSGISATWVRQGREFDVEDGTWELIGDFDIGAKFAVAAKSDGFARTVITMTTSHAPQPKDGMFRLVRGNIVKGHVVDATSGAAVEGARVVVLDAHHRPSRYYETDFHGKLVASTDARGRFRIEDVCAGETQLKVSHPDRMQLVDGPFEVDSQTELDRLIKMHPRVGLDGTVRDLAGAPIPNADVQIQLTLDSGGSDRRRVKTDSSGAFKVDGVELGSCLAWVQPSGPLPHSLALGTTKISAGTTSLVVAPVAGGGVLRGSIKPAGGLPERLPFELVRTDNRGTFQFISAVAVDGMIHTRHVPPGRYRAIVHVNEKHALASVEIVAGQETTISLDLQN